MLYEIENELERKLQTYVEIFSPIIYINTLDYMIADDIISRVSKKTNAKCLEYSQAFGLVDFANKERLLDCNIDTFLIIGLDEGFEQNTFLILKDVDKEIDNSKTIALLKRIAELRVNGQKSDVEYGTIVFIISNVTVIPEKLERYISLLDIKLPSNKEISFMINRFVNDVFGGDKFIDDDIIDELSVCFKGLNRFQIERVLGLVYHSGGDIDRNDKKMILQEKSKLINKAGTIRLVNSKYDFDDVGGLNLLKRWLEDKEIVFSNIESARNFGVDMPKGIMILGVPGCGKSLVAKATSKLFNIPLIHFDIGMILGKYVGESEHNLRKALELIEVISPCVLWIDEIEKAFVGVGASSEVNEVTTRLFGQLLTWMQEKEDAVFIIATANDTGTLPSEFWRRGRFDEIFFVGLPNEKDRENIFDIHINKRKKNTRWRGKIDIKKLAEETLGFSGADIECVVKNTIEDAFINHIEIINTDIFIKFINEIKESKGELDKAQAEHDYVDSLKRKYGISIKLANNGGNNESD